LDEEEFGHSFESALKEIQRKGEREAADTSTRVRPAYGATAARGQNEFTGYDGTRIDEAKIVASSKRRAK